jgi:hypothetical protein
MLATEYCKKVGINSEEVKEGNQGIEQLRTEADPSSLIEHIGEYCSVCKEKVLYPYLMVDSQSLATENISGGQNLRECLVCRMSSFDPQSRVIDCLYHNISD